MAVVRPLNEKKYGISENRFRELYYFCLQYHEWKDRLKFDLNGIKAISGGGTTKGGAIPKPTDQTGTLRAELSKKCEIIEQTAIEADPGIHEYILKAVTNEMITYHYLKTVMKIPCGRKMYYDRRRKFYWLLDKKI